MLLNKCDGWWWGSLENKHLIIYRNKSNNTFRIDNHETVLMGLNISRNKLQTPILSQ